MMRLKTPNKGTAHSSKMRQPETLQQHSWPTESGQGALPSPPPTPLTRC